MSITYYVRLAAVNNLGADLKRGSFKYFISEGSNYWSMKYSYDMSPLGNLLNWMKVKGSDQGSSLQSNRVILNTYPDLRVLAIF